jgi:hypothetical protein
VAFQPSTFDFQPPDRSAQPHLPLSTHHFPRASNFSQVNTYGKWRLDSLVTPLKSTRASANVRKTASVSPAEPTLALSLQLKSPGINTCKKHRGVGSLYPDWRLSPLESTLGGARLRRIAFATSVDSALRHCWRLKSLRISTCEKLGGGECLQAEGQRGLDATMLEFDATRSPFFTHHSPAVVMRTRDGAGSGAEMGRGFRDCGARQLSSMATCCTHETVQREAQGLRV